MNVQNFLKTIWIIVFFQIFASALFDDNSKSTIIIYLYLHISKEGKVVTYIGNDKKLYQELETVFIFVSLYVEF